MTLCALAAGVLIVFSGYNGDSEFWRFYQNYVTDYGYLLAMLMMTMACWFMIGGG